MASYKMRASLLLVTVASILVLCHGMELTGWVISHRSTLLDATATVLKCSSNILQGQLYQWQMPGGTTLLVNREGKVLGNNGKHDGIKVFNSPSILQVVYSDASTDFYEMAANEFGMGCDVSNSFPVYKNEDYSYIFVNCEGQWSLGEFFISEYTHHQNNPTPVSPPLTGWKLIENKLENKLSFQNVSPNQEIYKDKVIEKIVASERSICGIIIKEKNSFQYKGDWTCGINLKEKEEGEKGAFLGAVVNTEKKVISNLRLAKHLKPIHYDLSLIADLFSNNPDVDDYFGGKVVMKLEAQDTSDYVVFHADGLNIKYVEISSVDGVDNQLLQIGGIIFDYERTLVKINLKNSLFITGKIYEVSVIYDSTPILGNRLWNVDKKVGFYRQKCGDVLCWFTQFEGTFARRAFPCLDEPAMKATFSVRVARTDGWTALSNMPLFKTTPVDMSQSWAWQILNKTLNLSSNNNLVWDIFEPTVKMSTYLVAVCITDYAAVGEPHNHVKVWGPKNEIKQGRGNFSCKIGSQLIDYFESCFKIKYSVPKTDMISLSYKRGAMENWGLITFDHSLLLPEHETDYSLAVEVISHELAHEWLGNLVTAKWWDHIWLNEGLTHFFSKYGVDHVFPEAKPWDTMITDNGYIAPITKDMNVDVSETKAMSESVITVEEIYNKFDSITYGKGGIIVRMMEHILTKPVFLKGLRSYLSSLSFGNAVEEDLFNHLEAAGIEDGTWNNIGNHSFSTSMKTWTDQAGVPLVTVTRDWESSNESFSLKQSRFFYSIYGDVKERLLEYQSAVSSADSSQWDIPISMTTVGGPNDDWNNTKPSLWLTTDQPQLANVTLPGLSSQVPIVLNIQRMGYFLVNYDEENWKLIGDALANNKDDIHPYNRAQIIFDITLLANIGVVRQQTKENVLRYIQEEDNRAISDMWHYINEDQDYFEYLFFKFEDYGD